MRKIFAIATLFLCLNVTAQESFEGTIRYSARALKEKDTIQIQIDFAPKAIKVYVMEPMRESKNKDFLLIDFDSGKVYSINHHFKSYTSHKLVERKPMNEVPQMKSIAGYSTIGEVYNEEGVNHIFGSMLSNKTVFYTAEKLFYNLPDKYYGNFELMMVQKNRIVLGAEIHLAPRLGLFGRMIDEEDSANSVSIFIEAKEIVAKRFGPDEFSIPQGFEKRKPYTYNRDEAMMRDSVDSAYRSDSIAIIAPTVDFEEKEEAKAVIKKRPSKPKKKSTTKQNTIRRKDD